MLANRVSPPWLTTSMACSTAPLAGYSTVAAVGVPDANQRAVAGAGRVDRPDAVVVAHVGDAEDLRDRLGTVCRLGKDLERPEMAAEGHLLLIGDRLPAEEKHPVPGPGVPDGFHGGLVQRPGQIDPR